jgi:sulfur carrier protein
MIELTVNGKPRTIERPLTLSEYLEQLGINPQVVAVEHNGEIVRRERYGATKLGSGDVLEIVRMVGGGAPDAAWPAWPRLSSMIKQQGL